VAARWIEGGVVVLVALTGGLTLFVAFLIWRDGFLRGWRSARQSPPTCLRCGYNLSGLKQCRCPECGSEFELDKLWNAYLFPNGDRGRKGAEDPAERRS
jgi:hypothetical protein